MNRTSGSWETTPENHIFFDTGVSEGKEKLVQTQKKLLEIIAENFLNLTNNINAYSRNSAKSKQDAQHIIIKLLKTKDLKNPESSQKKTQYIRYREQQFEMRVISDI